MTTRNTVSILFSKDRPLQLDATIRGFFLHCRDSEFIKMKVIWAASDALMEELYLQMAKQFAREHGVEFIRETEFRFDVLKSLNGFEYVMFLVDDNLFVKDFLVRQVTDSLDDYPQAIGFSLRLGRNTSYCYPVDQSQRLPEFDSLNGFVLQYDWTRAEFDFGYPLEVSSSVYRVTDMLSLLTTLEFRNPNTLEALMAKQKSRFIKTLFLLLCFETSVSFCSPLNRVQAVYENRAGNRAEYSPVALLSLYLSGQRINIQAYDGFVPIGCHQEVELKL